MAMLTTSTTEPSCPVVEQRVILHDVSWATYEELLADLANQSAVRLAYSQGTLEIMSPSTEHEIYNRIIALLVDILAEEISVNIKRLGSSTFKRDDLERGFEPDSCFYVQNFDRVKGKFHINLVDDPPPDLVVEVDVTSGSLNKLPIYAKVGVPEIWRYDGHELGIHKLSDADYLRSEQSLAFPSATSRMITDLIERTKNLDGLDLVRSIRALVRENLKSEKSK
jgi:Uma2 family endonuclease